MIYLDHNSTTYMLPEVSETLYEILKSNTCLNASAIHSMGRKAKSLIEDARINILSLFNAKNSHKLVFTSGATEANNLIIKSFSDADIFISAIEHNSIFEFSKINHNVQLINVDNDGIINIEDLRKKLKLSTKSKKLVSVMLANNETGVIEPIREIANICKKEGALLHSDCAQAAGKIPIDLVDLNVDYISISAHKFGGPMGVGALIAKEPLHLKPLLIGGGQEEGIRSGTENTLSIAGFGAAALSVKKNIISRMDSISAMRNFLEEELSTKGNVEIISKNVNRLPNTTQFIMSKGIKADTQLIAFDLEGVGLSRGSACSSGRVKSSHVLSAMGYRQGDIESALRISLGWNTTINDIKAFLKIYDKVGNN